MRPLRALAAAALGAGVSAFLALPAAAASQAHGCDKSSGYYPAHDCSATVTKQAVHPGSRLSVKADRFAKHEIVTVSVDNPSHVLARIESSGRGDVHATLVVPQDLSAGSHELLLTGRRSEVRERARLTVVPAALATPLSGSQPDGMRTGTFALAVVVIAVLGGFMLFVGGVRPVVAGGGSLKLRSRGGASPPPAGNGEPPPPAPAPIPDAGQVPPVVPHEPLPERVDLPAGGVADNDPAALIEGLREENDALRMRIAQLEEGVAEYRRQMTSVLTSVSWRVTAPIRNYTGKMRLLRTRVKGLRRRLAQRSHPPRSATTGLFPPGPPPAHSLATSESPLLSRLHRVVPQRREAAVTHNRVLVVAHVYYPEVWTDIEDRLARMPEPYDLVVTLVRGHAERLEPELTRRFPFARIHHVENYGRDLGSLLELANMGVFDGYDAILKVHTKRSPHRLDGDAWRVTLLDGVLPSPEGIRRFLDLMRRDPTVGVIAPDDQLKGPETWGSDRELVEALAARIPLGFDPDGLLYPAGSMYWARPWVIQRLADLHISAEHFELEADHLDGSTAHALERFVGIITQASGLDVLEAHEVPSRLHRARRTKATRPKVLAFYLPQYHAVPENDEWWGEGFTDWRKVDAAVPLYEGHLQPHEPSELGHYDLSDATVMSRQAELARTYGVDGFVMYHYWFDGHRLLDTPLRNLLANPDIDFPFALCWANENWTRRWDGLDEDVLIAQRYGHGWADAFFDDIADALADPRYLKVGNKPLLLVYRPGLLRDGRRAIARWRKRAAEAGLGGLHVLGVVPSRDFEDLPRPVASALDGLVRFPPGSGVGLESVAALAPGLSAEHAGDVYSYDAAVDGADLSTTGQDGLPVHLGVMPGWDNTARRRDASYVFHGSNPASFRRWLARAVSAAAADGRMVFVNAWNEWAEGAHLEPDKRFGCGNLEAIRDVVGAFEGPSPH